ncbi:MAG: ribosome recycling factor [Clostridia bacterium]|nr:ribosome recycling factor [Clostridia bacterium]
MRESYPETEAKMDKTISFFVEELAVIRVGRANPSVLDKISVDYYGTPTPIGQVGTISTPDPHTLLVQPWDATLLKAVERAISASELGINPQNDGKVIRLSFPSLTEDRRKELTKSVGKKAEDAKIALRSIRRDAIEVYKAQKKKSEITEDDLKNIEKDIQELTDDKIKEVDAIAARKNKEILEI